MQGSKVRTTLLISLPIGILMGATGALAGVSLLEEAGDHVEKAAHALRKADSPRQWGEFGGHRKRALELLDGAKDEIKKAKEFVGQHPDKPPAPSPKPDPTASGPKKPPGPPMVPPKKPGPIPPKKDPEPAPPKKPEPPATPPKK